MSYQFWVEGVSLEQHLFYKSFFSLEFTNNCFTPFAKVCPPEQQEIRRKNSEQYLQGLTILVFVERHNKIIK